MDQEPRPEQFHQPEEEPQAIETLPENLGFTESPELSQLRGQLVEAIATSSEKVRDLANQYHLLAEQVVNQHQGEDFAKAQIGLIVAIGLIERDGGKIDDYIVQLQDASKYAFQMGFRDIENILEVAIIKILTIETIKIIKKEFEKPTTN